MTPSEIRELWPYLTEKERVELETIIAADMEDVPWRELPGPQTMVSQSEADIIGFGGSAGGGKTDLVCGHCLQYHARALVVRREKTQTEGIVQRLTEIIESTSGYNSQKGVWRLPNKRSTLVEFAGLDNPGDERRWQGRPHDLKAFDEVTEMREQQVRFVMGWNRTNDTTVRAKVLMTFNPPTTSEGRWVLEFFGPWLDKKHPLYPTPPGVLRWAAMLPDSRGGSKDRWTDQDGALLTGAPFVLIDGRVVYDFDPKQHKPEDIIQPKSRTFIPARVTDNPYYMASGYMSTLQSLPEPLRSQMLYGDFQAGIEDDAWQLIPTAWVELAQSRWTPRSPRGEMLNMGVDVARGGKDNTIIAPRHRDEKAGHNYWFDVPKIHPGESTPNGSKVAGLVIAERRNDSPVCIDVIGVGASPYDKLNELDVQVIGVDVREKATASDKSGKLRLFNLRSQLGWKLRELFDPDNDTGIAIPNEEACPGLLRELTTPKWALHGVTIQVEGREDIIKRLGKSPDYFSAICLACLDIPKIKALRAANARMDTVNYDPLAHMRGADDYAPVDYDPMGRL